jgi:DNA-directed RNA polymerase specialized sigma24 family protein
MNREGLWKMNRKTACLLAVLPMLACAVPVIAAPAQQQGQEVSLPTAQQLVIMSIPDRLALFQSMQTLPPNQRDANLKTLRAEINSLSPGQKEEMRQHFQTEFNALPPDRQQAVMDQLKSVQGN